MVDLFIIITCHSWESFLGLPLAMKNGFRQIPQFLTEWVMEKALLEKNTKLLRAKGNKKRKDVVHLNATSTHERC